MPTQTEQQRANAYAAAGIASPQDLTVSASDLTAASPIKFQEPTPSLIPDITKLGANYDLTQQEKQSQTDYSNIQSETQSLIASLAGESQYRASQMTAQDVSGIEKQQQELSNRVKQLQAEALAIPLRVQEQYKGLGATAGGVEPVQTSQLRNNAIQALSTASLLEATQGNLTLAYDLVDRAVAAQYDPIKAQINANISNLQLISQSPAFTTAKQKQAEQRAAQEANKRLAVEYAIEEQRYNSRGVVDTMNIAASYGAPQDVLRAISSATTYEGAVAAAGSYLRDPLAKQQLINAQTDAKLKQMQIQRESYEFSLLQKYGGMTPSQYASYVKSQQADIAAAKDAASKKQAQAAVLNEKVDLTQAILNSSAIGSVVGTVPGISRTPGSTIGKIAGLLNPLTAKSTAGGLFDIATGAQQSLIGSTEQLISKEFLESLINTKAQGATFGALTEKEQSALTDAATLIGGRRVYNGSGDTKQVVGYNISEADFKAEVQRIQDLARIAYQRAQGESWSSDEQDTWDAIQQIQTTTNFSPAF